jgi:hypothetical protein
MGILERHLRAVREVLGSPDTALLGAMLLLLRLLL